MSDNVTETLIGAVILVVAGGFLVFAANTADVSTAGGYGVIAKFRKAEGLNVGGDVRIAGVKVGTISDMELDRETYFAALTLRIRDDVRIPDDSGAKITASSLLGDSYVAIDPGASEFMMEAGGEIPFTQGSVSIGDLIGKFIQGAGSIGE